MKGLNLNSNFTYYCLQPDQEIARSLIEKSVAESHKPWATGGPIYGRIIAVAALCISAFDPLLYIPLGLIKISCSIIAPDDALVKEGLYNIFISPSLATALNFSLVAINIIGIGAAGNTPIQIETQETITGEMAQEFIKAYETEFGSFSHLRLSRKELELQTEELCSIGTSVLSYTDIFFTRRLSHALKAIDEKFDCNQLKEHDKELIKQVVNHLVLFSCLVPCRESWNSSSSGSLNLNSMEIVSPILALDILESMAKQDIIEISKNHYLNHIETDDFIKSTQLQKILLLNLANICSDARRELLKDNLFQSIKLRADLKEWVFACSGSLEQNFLNSCGSTTLCQDLLTKSSTIASALFLTNALLDQFDRSIMEPSDDKADPLVIEIYRRKRKTIEKEKKDIKNLKLRLIDSESLCPPLLIKKFMNEWSLISQRIGLLNNDETTLAHPSPKIISNHYFTSAALTLIPNLVKDLIQAGDFPLKMEMRLEGTADKLTNELNHILYGNQEPYAESIKADLKQLEQTSIENFWYTLFLNGGVTIEKDLWISSHSLYLRAIKLNGQKVFILSDPMTSNYHLLDFSSFLDYIKGCSTISITS